MPCPYALPMSQRHRAAYCYSGRTDGAEGVSMRQFDPDSNPMTEADYGIVLGLFIGIYLGLLVVSALP